MQSITVKDISVVCLFCFVFKIGGTCRSPEGQHRVLAVRWAAWICGGDGRQSKTVRTSTWHLKRGVMWSQDAALPQQPPPPPPPSWRQRPSWASPAQPPGASWLWPAGFETRFWPGSLSGLRRMKTLPSLRWTGTASVWTSSPGPAAATWWRECGVSGWSCVFVTDSQDWYDLRNETVEIWLGYST